jgi:DmsE family decaheme c-type cytochrome
MPSTVGQCTRRGLFVGACACGEFFWRQTKFFAITLFLWLVSSIVVTANAVEATAQDGVHSALRDYLQLIDRERGSPADAAQDSHIFSRQDSTNATYAALRASSEQIGVEQPAPTGGMTKMAAKTLMDALRQKNAAPQSSPATPATPSSKGPAAGGTEPNAPVESTYVGAKVCVTCHANQTEAFSKTLMGRISKTQKGKFDCENCHGPGSAHVFAGGGRGVGGIISFRPEDRSRTAEQNNAICLGCHERGARTNWAGSTHDTRGLMCSNCHTVMKQVSRKFQLKTAFEPDTCFQCHKNRRAQIFRSSHMPVREGKIVCSDCHNPHGSFTEALLKKDSINDTCYTCHAEKRGPFLFEHLPVRENCDNCHDPHGTVNEFSLKLSRPRLCFECHGAGHGGMTNGPGSVLTMGRQCQNCHTAVHGSNSPSGGAFQR